MKVFLIFLCLCASVSFANNREFRGISSSSSYTTPTCEREEGFYCPTGPQRCLPRTDRCTRENSDNQTECLEKTYRDCNYNPAAGNGKFRVYRYSTPLNLFGRREVRNALKNPFACLNNRIEHQFILYRGLLYEYGTYGARIQDPNDPNYEYRPDGRSTTGNIYVGDSSCTYEQVSEYLKMWNSDDYCLCTYNCQDFARGLGTYLTNDCKKTSRKRSSSSDDEFAKYIFSISGDGQCNKTLDLSSSGSPQQSVPFIQFVAAIVFAGSFAIVF